MREVVSALGPRAWRDVDADVRVADEEPRSGGAWAEVDEAFARRAFVGLSPGEQSVVLLMRALVGRPQLVLLDEAWAGMDENMIRAARRYLRKGGVGHDQAVVVVSHWEEEIPWMTKDGLYTFKLQDGIGTQI